MNKVTFEIVNCCDCPYHYTEFIWTPDSWEHERGVFCEKVLDKDADDYRHKLVCADGWDVRKYADIPDWCPLLKSKN